MAMNEEIKSRWVAALRSGQYMQGDGYLNKAGKYCCLGVLCDIQGTEWKQSGKDTYSVDGSNQMPSTETLESWGIEQHQASQLWKMNDNFYGKPYSFDEIADYIEKEL